jgi:hypothetical protein
VGLVSRSPSRSWLSVAENLMSSVKTCWGVVAVVVVAAAAAAEEVEE